MRRINEDEIRKITPEAFEAFSNELEKAGKSLDDLYYYVHVTWWDGEPKDETSTPDDPIFIPIWNTFQALRNDFTDKTRVGEHGLDLDLIQETIGTQGEFTEFRVFGGTIVTLSPAAEKMEELLNR